MADTVDLFKDAFSLLQPEDEPKKPEESVPKEEPKPVEEEDQDEWVELTDKKTGKHYYHNKTKKVTQWKQPANWDAIVKRQAQKQKSQKPTQRSTKSYVSPRRRNATKKLKSKKSATLKAADKAKIMEALHDFSDSDGEVPLPKEEGTFENLKEAAGKQGHKGESPKHTKRPSGEVSPRSGRDRGAKHIMASSLKKKKIAFPKRRSRRVRIVQSGKMRDAHMAQLKVQAMNFVAECYEKGIGGPIDLEKAKQLYKVAADKGSASAGLALSRMEEGRYLDPQEPIKSSQGVPAEVQEELKDRPDAEEIENHFESEEVNHDEDLLAESGQLYSEDEEQHVEQEESKHEVPEPSPGIPSAPEIPGAPPAPDMGFDFTTFAEPTTPPAGGLLAGIGKGKEALRGTGKKEESKSGLLEKERLLGAIRGTGSSNLKSAATHDSSGALIARERLLGEISKGGQLKETKKTRQDSGLSQAKLLLEIRKGAELQKIEKAEGDGLSEQLREQFLADQASKKETQSAQSKLLEDIKKGRQLQAVEAPEKATMSEELKRQFLEDKAKKEETKEKQHNLLTEIRRGSELRKVEVPVVELSPALKEAFLEDQQNKKWEEGMNKTEGEKKKKKESPEGKAHRRKPSRRLKKKSSKMSSKRLAELSSPKVKPKGKGKAVIVKPVERRGSQERRTSVEGGPWSTGLKKKKSQKSLGKKRKSQTRKK